MGGRVFELVSGTVIADHLLAEVLTLNLRSASYRIVKIVQQSPSSSPIVEHHGLSLGKTGIERRALVLLRQGLVRLQRCQQSQKSWWCAREQQRAVASWRTVSFDYVSTESVSTRSTHRQAGSLACHPFAQCAYPLGHSRTASDVFTAAVSIPVFMGCRLRTPTRGSWIGA